MTVEEMAEEYVRNHVYYEVAKRENGAEYAKEVSNVTVKEAFLAGLEAGKPKWHDLRENPDDLPPLEGRSISINVLTDNGMIVYYYYTDCVWYELNGFKIAPPKAWCEIPVFKG